MGLTAIPGQNQMGSLALNRYAQMLGGSQGSKQNNFVTFKTETDKVFEQAEAADEMMQRLKQMQKLNNRGNMGSPLIASALKMFKLDFASLFTTDSQEFEKLTVDMTKFARQYFGNRISADVVKLFLKSIPNRTMTKAARQRVIESLMQFAQPALDKRKRLLEIYNKNGKQLPDDYAFQMAQAAVEAQNKAEDKVAQLSQMTPKEQEKQGIDYLPEPNAPGARGTMFYDNKLLDKNGLPTIRVSDGNSWNVISNEDAFKYMQGIEESPTPKQEPTGKEDDDDDEDDAEIQAIEMMGKGGAKL